MTEAAPVFENRAPHYDSDLEETVIAHILARPNMLPDVEAYCGPEHFACGIFARIFEAAQFLRDTGATCSPLVMKAKLSGEVSRDIEKRTGREVIDYLEALAMQARPGQKPVELARLVADRALRRRIDAELEAGRSRLFDYARPVSDCLADVMSAAGRAVDAEAKEAGHQGMADAVDMVLHEAEDAINGKPVAAIKTGITKLDYVTGGFQGGDMVVVAGRPGQGKTVLLTTIARSAAMIGAPVIFFEMEMRRKHLIHRLCADLDYDSCAFPDKPLAFSRMRKGVFRPGEWDRFYGAAQKLRGMPIDIFDTSGLTIQEIGSHAQRFVDKARKLGVVIVDYFQIIAGSGGPRDSRYTQLTEASIEVKRLAKRLGWPVVIGCQLNREIEKRDKNVMPRLSDLKETGQLEQDADVVIGMHRPLYYVNQRRPIEGKDSPEWMDWLGEKEKVKHHLDLPILKNRGGPDAYVRAFVDIGASVIRNDGHGTGNEAEDDPGQELLDL